MSDVRAAAEKALEQLGIDGGFEDEQAGGEPDGDGDVDVTTEHGDDSDDDPDDASDGDGLEEDDEDGDDGEPDDGELDGGDEDDGESGEEDPEPVELDDDDLLVVDGEQKTWKEVREAQLREADYTQKSQANAKERRELEELRTELDDWSKDIETFVDQVEKRPDEMIDRIAGDASNPTLTVVKAIKRLADAGKLDNRFTSMLGLDQADSDVADIAQDSEKDERLTRLEQAEKERREQAQQASEVQQVRDRILQDWNGLKDREGFEFDSQAEERAYLAEVAKYGAENGMGSVVQAWESRELQRLRAQEQRGKKKRRSQKPKRSSRAINKRGTGSGGGSGAGAAQEEPVKTGDTREAAKAAVAKLLNTG